jgi:hypothetical protein
MVDASVPLPAVPPQPGSVTTATRQSRGWLVALTIVLHGLVGLFTLSIFMFVVPKFRSIAADLDAALPWSTMVLFGVSDILMTWWPVALLVVFGATVGITLLVQRLALGWQIAWLLGALVVPVLVAALTVFALFPIMTAIIERVMAR